MTTDVDTKQTNGHAMVMPNGEKMINGEKIPNGGPMSNGLTVEEKTSPMDKTGQNQAEPKYDPGKDGLNKA